MIKIVSKEIPHAYRNKYLRASGNTVVISGGATTSGNASGGSGTGDLDISVFAQRDEANTFTKDNIFKGGITIDNPAPSLIIKRNTVQVATLGYDASKLCVSLSSTEANKGLNLFDDGRFEFGGHAVYHAGNCNLNTVEWSAKTLFSNVLKAANQAELVKYDGTNTVLGALAGTTTIQSKAADLLHSKGGANYIIWDASNSNLNSVDWKAKNIFAKDHVQNDNFVSGYTGTGCRISADGKAECTDLWVRGTMNVYELIVNKINATNGALAVSDTGKVATVSGSTLTLTGDNDNMNTFRVGDVLKCQRFTGKNVKLYFLTVTAITGLNVTFIYRSGGSGANTVAAGDVLVRWNSSDANRKGLLYLTASDSQAPYMDVLYNEQVRLRLGRLDGIADSAFPASTQPSGFGLYAQNAFLKGVFILTSGKTVDGEITVASNKANAAQSTANNAQSTANGAKSAADAAQSTANSAQTAANNANNAITTIRTELSAVDGKITLAVNESKTYTNNSINNLQIGGRNLARGTSNEWRSFPITNGVNICWNGYGGSVYIDGEKISTNDTIIVSFDVKYSNMKKQALGSGEAYRCILQGSGNVTGWSSGIPGCDLLSQINFSTGTGEFHVSYSFKLNSTQLTNTRFDTNIRHDRLTGTLSVRNFKAEKGNKATDWTPAPEDMAQDAQDKANAALNAAKTYTNSEISVVNGKINLKVDSSTFNALGNRVSAAETRITQTENSIKLKADQTTVNGINSRLQSAEAKITPDAIRLTVKDQATQLANTAANNAVNGLQIGGTNLLTNTALLINNVGWGSTRDTGKILEGRYSLKQVSTGLASNAWRGSEQTNSTYLIANVGEVFTASIYSYTDNRSSIDIGCAMEIRYYNSAGARITQSAVSILPSANNTWQRFILTGRCPAGTVRVGFVWYVTRNGTLWVNGMKLEKGNKATDWTASPYDGPTVEQIKSQFTIDANGISMLGKKISLAGMVTFSSLNSDLQSKINTALNRKIGLAQMDTTVISGGYIKTSLINTDELVAKKISAATGTFERLDAANGKGYIGLDGNGIGLFATGNNVITMNTSKFWVYGDMYSQGTTNNRSNRYYSGNIWCRGSLGFTQLNTVEVFGSYAYYYPDGYGQNKTKVYASLKSATSAQGQTYYIIPLYSPAGYDALTGFPVNFIKLSWSGATTTYRYVLAGQPGQHVIAFNANDGSNDNTRVIFCSGRQSNVAGGQIVHYVNVGNFNLYPSIPSENLGAGWLVSGYYDNNWR